MKRCLVPFVGALLLWLTVTWSLEPISLVAGVLICALVGYALRHVEPEEAPLLLLPHRLLWLLIYLPVLFVQIVRANLDVAFRVLHPALPIRPGIVRARTMLKSPSARVLLANSVTLTPGTLTVDLVDDVLYIHRIYVPEQDPDAQTERSLGAFEPIIRRIFE